MKNRPGWQLSEAKGDKKNCWWHGLSKERKKGIEDSRLTTLVDDIYMK